METVDQYISSLEPADRVVFEVVASQVKAWVPEVTQGLSYGMPAFKYKDKALLSVMACKNHYGVYPFSGKVIAKLEDQLSAYKTTSGSVHFTKRVPIPGSLLKTIIEARLAEIDGAVFTIY